MYKYTQGMEPRLEDLRRRAKEETEKEELTTIKYRDLEEKSMAKEIEHKRTMTKQLSALAAYREENRILWDKTEKGSKRLALEVKANEALRSNVSSLVEDRRRDKEKEEEKR